MEHVFLPVGLCEREIEEMCGRYHFGDTGLIPLKGVYADFFAASAVSIYFIIRQRTGSPVEKEAVVLMTLGKEPDKLQEDFMQKEQLTEAYMVDCIAMELLSRAYVQADELLHQRTGLWCMAYQFPGVQQPIGEIKELFRLFTQEEVRYNEAYALLPQKSVIYTVPLSEKKKGIERAEEMCAACGRKDCAGRRHREKKSINLNYGYQRIFGEEKV